MNREKQLFSDRLIQAMLKCPDARNPNTKHGVDTATLQRIAGVSREMARRYLEGMAIPNPDPMRAIAEWLGVRVAWLRDGEGPMMAGAQPMPPEEQAALFGSHDRSIATLLDSLATRIDRADPAVREEIMRLTVRYLENPDAGARIARAIETLLEENETN